MLSWLQSSGLQNGLGITGSTAVVGIPITIGTNFDDSWRPSNSKSPYSPQHLTDRLQDCKVLCRSRADTSITEEPYEGNLHVRICGGAGRETAGSTRTTKRRMNVGKGKSGRRYVPLAERDVS